MADKIIVFHMGSDNTGAIAKKLGATIINKFKTNKPDFILVQKAINWAIDNCKTDWILRLDADERVTEELKIEINQMLNSKSEYRNPCLAGRQAKQYQNSNDQNHKQENFENLNLKNSNLFRASNFEFRILKNTVAYGIPRRQYFLGAFLRGGDWYYDRLVRLFQPKFCRYDPIVSVHEQFKVNGEIGYLKNSLLHYSHPTLTDVIKKFNTYTDVEINDLKISKLQAMINLFWKPPYIFTRWIIYHHGYRDGSRGVIAGFFRSWYEWLLYWKYLRK